MLKDIEEKKKWGNKNNAMKMECQKKKKTLKFWRKNAISLKQQDAFFFFLRQRGSIQRLKLLENENMLVEIKSSTEGLENKAEVI